jgi:putative methionine-R-sulfoxide reductase with GAF domain
MTDAIKILLEKQPSWFFHVSSLVLLIILGIIGYWVFIGAKRYSDAIAKEDKLVTLLEERNLIRQEKESNRAITDQICVVLENSTTFIKALNNFNNEEYHVNNHVQTIIESLATDVKTVIGERHRCGFWLADENNSNLTLANGSAAFPFGYVNNKTLDINNSIAGRCYRKKETIFIDDVSQDPDWSTTDNQSSYTSLICVPVGPWGVITIDGKQKMTHNTVLIGKLYASIIEGYMNKFLLGQVSDFTQTEVAASVETIDEGGE